MGQRIAVASQSVASGANVSLRRSGMIRWRCVSAATASTNGQPTTKPLHYPLLNGLEVLVGLVDRSQITRSAEEAVTQRER